VLVSSEKRAAYTQVIDSILADKNTDLNEISEKRIRKGLQETLDYDITPQKVSCHPKFFSRGAY
jgi:upstream activation factor subunit UAF30